MTENVYKYLRVVWTHVRASKSSLIKPFFLKLNSLLKQQHSRAFCSTHSFQDCRHWWPTSMSTELDNLVVQEHTMWLPPNTHSLSSEANLVLSMGRRETVCWDCFVLFLVSLENVIALSQGAHLTNFQAHSGLTVPWGLKSACFAQESQPLILSCGDEQQAQHTEWPWLMDQHFYPMAHRAL